MTAAAEYAFPPELAKPRGRRPSGTIDPAGRAGLADRFARELVGPFTFERLAVHCWRRCPSRFGLKGFERRYPDTNKLSQVVFHRAKGLLAKGRLVREGKLFRVSRR